MAEKKTVNTFDYSAKRTNFEAFKFYIASVILGALLAVFAKHLFTLIWNETVPQYYYTYLMYVVSGIYTFAIGARILYTKKLKKGLPIFMFIFSVILAAPLGLITAFIPLAVLMTFEPENIFLK